MEFKSYLNAAERVAFVETVVNGSTKDGAYEPALYDYAFRFAIVGYMSDVDISSMDESAIAELLYCPDVTAMLKRDNVLIAGLERACHERIAMQREEWMVHFNSVVNPDPVNRLVDMIGELAEQIKGGIDPESVMDAVLKGQEKRTAARKKTMKKTQLKVTAKK